jgi:hypothetical protein
VSATAQSVLAAGALTQLVRSGLVRHQAAVQAMAPPMMPSCCVTCGGFVARIGMAAATAAPAPEKPSPSAAGAPGGAAAAAPKETSNAYCSVDLQPSDYELVVSAINLRATLLSRFDVAQRLSTACIAYDASVRVDVEAGFKRAQLSALLRDPEVSDVVREVHESTVVAWLHPGDGDALLASWRQMATADAGRGGARTARSTSWSAEDMRCAS